MPAQMLWFTYFYSKFIFHLKGSIKYLPWVGKLLVLLGIYLIVEYIFALMAVEIINAIFPGMDFLHFITGFEKINLFRKLHLTRNMPLKFISLLHHWGVSFFVAWFLFIYVVIIFSKVCH
jgi:hypothetical protein